VGQMLCWEAKTPVSGIAAATLFTKEGFWHSFLSFSYKYFLPACPEKT